MFFRRKFQPIIFFFVFLFVGPFPSYAQQTRSGMVVADSELATRAGTEVLNRGGNAVDASIATAFGLAVVDQASSGLGGGGFMVVYNAKDHRADPLDLRQSAAEPART